MTHNNDLTESPTIVEDLEPPIKQNQPTNLDNTELIDFISMNYPSITIEKWNDWKWQIKNSITKSQDLLKILGEKKKDIILTIPDNHLPFRITPYLSIGLSYGELKATNLLGTIQFKSPFYTFS
jgi:hypothetical protein